MGLIHSTAVIHPKAELDPSVEVGPYCVIDEHVRVAARCRLYQNVYLTGWTEMGESCVLHPGVVVGHDPQDTKYTGARTFCRIGKGTILREYVTVHRGTTPESSTVLGENCFLLCGSHVAHNCVLGNRVTLINNALLAGHVEVGDGVTIGGGAGVHQFVRIGKMAMISGNARVPMDVVPFALTDVEGRVAGLNRVGLRRSQMSAEQREQLRRAYRVLFGGGKSFQDALDQLTGALESANRHEATGDSPQGLPNPLETLLRFLQASSVRGIAGSHRVKKRAS